MRKSTLTLLLQLLIYFSVLSQSQIRKLPAVINHPSLNVIAPYLSADGNALVFVSDGGQDGSLIASYTSRETEWAVPVELPKHVSNRLNFLKGFALSADGSKLYVTSAKAPIIGGYDIMTSDLKGNTWSNPVNMMLPINSTANEGSPSLTPDGNTIYFMRCDKMDQYKAQACKIFKSTKKPNGQWADPVELPLTINTGNSQAPRILPDGQTLIFSSDKMTPNKGGMDLYISRQENGEWSAPVALDFVNSDKDDQYVTVSAVGRYLLKEAKGARNNYELTEFLFPTNLRPKGLMKVEGKIAGKDGAIVPSYLSVIDLQTGKRILSTTPMSDGSYFFYLPEGTQYEFSVDPEQSNINYYSKFYDLTTEKIPQFDKVNVTLGKPAVGDVIPLEMVTFKPQSSELTSIAQQELTRFARMVRANPDLNFEVEVSLEGFQQDSLQSSPDLTEIKVDSIFIAADTVMQIPEQHSVRITYHNDRTLKQAEAINNFLVKQGIGPDHVAFVVRAAEADLPPRLRIQAVAK